MKKNTRYERKFFIDYLTHQEVEKIIKINPALFNYVYKQRFVNNIYFDSPNYTNYRDNIEGNPIRSKQRIRWYGDLLSNIVNPVFEIKNKHGEIGNKELYNLQDFQLKENMASSQLKKLLKDSQIPNEFKFSPMIPMLVNRYSRKYFQSFDRKYRITLDYDLSFFGICKNYVSFLHGHKDNNSIILELKYNSNYDNSVDSITKHFPFRITKSSKYVMGIEKCFNFL